MEKHALADLTGFALDTINEVGQQALSYYGKGTLNEKFDENLVTEAELKLRELFKNSLARRFPRHHIFGDQAQAEAYTHDESRYLWIFDAIDGVANFQAGIPIWASSLALIENFWPVFGVVYMPATGDRFQAGADDKALWGDREIHIPDAGTVNDESLLLTYSRFHLHYRAGFPGKIRNLGCTAAHLCYVAMGRADAALIAHESYADLAAAQIIVNAAGAKIQKVSGGEFFLNEYLDGQRIEDHLLVAAPGNSEQIRGYLERLP